MILKKRLLIQLFLLITVLNLNPAHAREYMVGTLAYSYIAGGYPNVFIQGTITEKSAWFIDKCDDDGNTLAWLYKKYRKKVSSGPYWYGGLIYVEKGSRSGTSLSAGMGYELLLKDKVSLGAYAGAAAGGNGQRFGVFDITFAYVFR